MRRATGITLQPHQMLRLPRKRNDSIVTAHIWNVIYNARSDRNLPPTSPNTAPATQKECHDWSASHMKRHLQCAERQASPCNLTKYCACHAKGMTVLLLLTYETSFTIRGATGISLQPHQILRLPRKRNDSIVTAHIWNVIYNARSDRNLPPTSPNIAPATQKECHDWTASHMKRHLQCAERQESPSNLTKYCACHAKGMSWLIRITYETSFTMRGATGITLQPHRILRLPRKIALPNLREIYGKQLKRHFQCATDPRISDHDPTMIRPRRAAKATFRTGQEQILLKITTFPAPDSGYHSKFHQMLHLPQKVTHELHQMLHLPQKVTRELHQMLRCHKKWHMNFTKCCSCHKKWHMNRTDYYYYYY